MHNLNNAYIYDSDQKIWKRRNATAFSYSDGSENTLLAALKKTVDKSVLSPALVHCQQDWGTTYHLSAMRSNLLRPFTDTLLPNASILELGCGCGAITRFLGETARHVLGVEGSEKRAAVAAQRCSDLGNVTIVADKIQDLPDSIGKFDVVTLIGVLEYSGSYGLKPIEPLNKALGIYIPNWDDCMRRALTVCIDNTGPLLVLANTCESLGIPPKNLEKHVIGLQKNIAALQERLKTMWKMLEKLK